MRSLNSILQGLMPLFLWVLPVASKVSQRRKPRSRIIYSHFAACARVYMPHFSLMELACTATPVWQTLLPIILMAVCFVASELIGEAPIPENGLLALVVGIVRRVGRNDRDRDRR